MRITAELAGAALLLLFGMALLLGGASIALKPTFTFRHRRAVPVTLSGPDVRGYGWLALTLGGALVVGSGLAIRNEIEEQRI